jgi:predicted dehydrogenase
MKKLRVGVVGLSIGQHHVSAYSQCPYTEVVALCDINTSILEKRSKEFNVKRQYTKYEEMLKENLDIVSIATPNYLHKDMCIKAFDSGAHVLCEKPLAINTSDIKTIKKAALAKKKKIMVNFSFRFQETSYALKSQVDAGVVGHIYYATTCWHRRRGFPGGGRGWFSDKKMAGGGPLIDLGVHRIDLALWLMGYPEPYLVLGSTYNYIGREFSRLQKEKYSVEDMSIGLVKFKNGATLLIEASWGGNRSEREFMESRFYGKKAGLLHRNIDEGYKFETSVFGDEKGCFFEKKLKAVNFKIPSAMTHFAESITNNKPHMCTIDEALNVQKIIDGIYKSAETGKAVNIGK